MSANGSDYPTGVSDAPPAPHVPALLPSGQNRTGGMVAAIGWLRDAILADTPAGTRRRLLLLILLPALVWIPTVTFDFVLDDIGTFIEDPLTQKPMNLFAILGNPVHAERASLPYYRPIVTISYWVDRALWGLNPAGFHLTNVAWHALNVLLAYWLLRRVGMTGQIALTASALFAVLPSHVEAVGWIQGRVDLIATAFVLMATYAGLLLQERPTFGRWLGGLGAFAMALLSKEPAVVLPGILILLWRSRGEPWRSSVGRLVPFLVVLIAYAELRQIILSRTAGFAFAFDHLPIRAAGLISILLEYLRIFIWPGLLPNFHMAVSQHGSIASVLTAVWLLVLMGLAVAFVAQQSGRRAWARSWLPIAVGALWFLLGLLPVLGVVWAKEAPRVGFLVTERYLYLPALGLCVVTAWAVARTWARAPWGLGGVALLLLMVSGSAVVRAQEWRDAETMYRAILPRTGDRTLAHANLGVLYLNRGETEAAITEFEAVLREDSAHAVALNNLGVARARQGQTSEALALYREAVRRKPAYADAWNNLGVLLEALENPSEARIAYQRALAIDPTQAQALRNLEELGAKAAGSRGESH